MKNILERKKKLKKNENKFILILKIFHIAHIPYCTQSIANSFALFYYYDSISYPFHIFICYQGMCYIVCYSGENVITFIIPFFLSSLSFLMCMVMYTQREEEKRKKFSSTSFIFGVAAATGSKCYFIC